jgi:hypothetical protein
VSSSRDSDASSIHVVPTEDPKYSKREYKSLDSAEAIPIVSGLRNKAMKTSPSRCIHSASRKYRALKHVPLTADKYRHMKTRQKADLPCFFFWKDLLFVQTCHTAGGGMVMSCKACLPGPIVTACDCKCFFDGPHNGGVYPPHHWHTDHVCTPKSWDHMVREEEKRLQRRHEYNERKRKHEKAFQTYINGSWPDLSILGVTTEPWTPEGSWAPDSY